MRHLNLRIQQVGLHSYLQMLFDILVHVQVGLLQPQVYLKFVMN